MVFYAGLDAAAARHNTRAIPFSVRFTSLFEGRQLYQRKLARQRKLFEARLDAVPTQFTFGATAL